MSTPEADMERAEPISWCLTDPWRGPNSGYKAGVVLNPEHEWYQHVVYMHPEGHLCSYRKATQEEIDKALVS